VLQPGDPVNALTVNNNLVLNNASVLQYALGSNSAETVVNGSLTLGGTLNLTDAGGFGPGTYVLISYGGALTNNGLTIGTTPYPSLTYQIDMSVTGAVRLVVSSSGQTNAFTAWQLQYFGCTYCPQAQPNADPLGKGMSNTNQFLAGLDPTDPASVFRVVSVAGSNTDVVVTWAAAAGKTDVVQVTSGSVTGDYMSNFQDVASVILSGSGDVTNNYVDSGGATNIPSRYYRIRLGP
jgi:hypothetical protein